MTNINCSSDCIYQKDGKCTFDSIISKRLTTNSNCAYYSTENKNDN